MSSKEPFFSQFIEAQELSIKEAEQVSGGAKRRGMCGGGVVVTRKYPSDDDEGAAIGTKKYPSDDDEGPMIVTMKYPSDDDEG